LPPSPSLSPPRIPPFLAPSRTHAHKQTPGTNPHVKIAAQLTNASEIYTRTRHHLDTFDGPLALSSLAREHDAIGALRNRRRNVGHLGARRARVHHLHTPAIKLLYDPMHPEPWALNPDPTCTRQEAGMPAAKVRLRVEG